MEEVSSGSHLGAISIAVGLKESFLKLPPGSLDMEIVRSHRIGARPAGRAHISCYCGDHLTTTLFCKSLDQLLGAKGGDRLLLGGKRQAQHRVLGLRLVENLGAPENSRGARNFCDSVAGQTTGAGLG